MSETLRSLGPKEKRAVSNLVRRAFGEGYSAGQSAGIRYQGSLTDEPLPDHDKAWQRHKHHFSLNQ